MFFRVRLLLLLHLSIVIALLFLMPQTLVNAAWCNKGGGCSYRASHFHLDQETVDKINEGFGTSFTIDRPPPAKVGTMHTLLYPQAWWPPAMQATWRTNPLLGNRDGVHGGALYTVNNNGSRLRFNKDDTPYFCISVESLGEFSTAKDMFITNDPFIYQYYAGFVAKGSQYKASENTGEPYFVLLRNYIYHRAALLDWGSTPEDRAGVLEKYLPDMTPTSGSAPYSTLFKRNRTSPHAQPFAFPILISEYYKTVVPKKVYFTKDGVDFVSYVFPADKSVHSDLSTNGAWPNGPFADSMPTLEYPDLSTKGHFPFAIDSIYFNSVASTPGDLATIQENLKTKSKVYLPYGDRLLEWDPGRGYAALVTANEGFKEAGLEEGKSAFAFTIPLEFDPPDGTEIWLTQNHSSQIMKTPPYGSNGSLTDGIPQYFVGWLTGEYSQNFGGVETFRIPFKVKLGGDEEPPRDREVRIYEFKCIESDDSGSTSSSKSTWFVDGPNPVNLEDYTIQIKNPSDTSFINNDYINPAGGGAGSFEPGSLELADWRVIKGLEHPTPENWSDVPSGNPNGQSWFYPDYPDTTWYRSVFGESWNYPSYITEKSYVSMTGGNGNPEDKPGSYSFGVGTKTHNESAGGDTIYLYYTMEDVCPPCEEDCPVGSSCGSDPTVEEVQMRWYSFPLAYAETKDGVGFENSAETILGKFTLPRSGEEFEAMMGVPETEKLYVNGGGSEGQIDVTYDFITVNQTFCLNWSENHVCGGHSCGEDCIWFHFRGTKNYTRMYNHTFKFLHLVNSSYRTPNELYIKNPDLYQEGDFIIPINAEVPASHTLTPNELGLDKNPGTDSGVNMRNIGATNSWETTVTVGPYTNVCKDGGPYHESQAIADGNARVGDIFAQNDALTITIGGADYVIVDSPNTQTVQPFGNNSNLIAAADQNVFKPYGELWISMSHIPIFGYNGEPETDASRNSDGTYGNNKPFLKEDIEIVKRQVNGVYDFNDYETENYLLYGTSYLVRDEINDLHKDISELKLITQENVIDINHYITPEDPNGIMVQYTNWQGAGVHMGMQPDGVRDETFEDNPNYYSINPVLIHNPTPAIYAWISDVPEHQLQDQRIIEGMNHDSPGSEGVDAYELTLHPRAYEEDAPARQYIDFDFKLYFPNDGPFIDYWEAGDAPDSVAKQYMTWHADEDGEHDPTQAGIIDINEVAPGTRGKGYVGTKQDPNKWRSWATKGISHYMGLGTQGYFEQEWDVSKWISSKYVKFPYDVYYYKNSGEVGGDPAGFYNAGTWIRLYDDQYEVKALDPTEFNFHVASHQKDVMNGVIEVVAENINAKTIPMAGNAQALFDDAEWYVNGKRDKGDGHYSAIGGKSVIMSASHSAKKDFFVDVIGRIGDSLIEDSLDPAWQEVFWNVDNNGNTKTQEVVSKDYGMYYNMFEQCVLPGVRKYDRFASLDWHKQLDSLKLPMMNNPLALKNNQVQKLGYENQFSVQTLGDHGTYAWDDARSQMFVYPTYKLAGRYKTGDPKTDHFKFFASDPFDPKGTIREFYDSRTLVGKFYLDSKPNRFQYFLANTLASARAKVSTREKSSPAYTAAVAAGSNKMYFTGEPAWINVDVDLMTYIGSTQSSGYLGHSNPSGRASSNNCGDCPTTQSGEQAPSVGTMTASDKADDAWRNAQKWTFRASLPRNTQIMFLKGNNEKTGTFEGRTKEQYIYTEFIYRTWGGFKEWDLTTYTNTGWGVGRHLPKNRAEFPGSPLAPVVTGNHDGSSTTSLLDIGGGSTIDGEVGIEPDYRTDNPQTGDYDNPATPEVVVDYSNPSNTDRTTIGTH